MAKHCFVKFEEKASYDIDTGKLNSYISTYINPKQVQYIVGGEAKSSVDIYLIGRKEPITITGYIENIIDELEDAI